MKRKAFLVVLFGLLSLAVALTVLSPLMGMKGFTFANSKSIRPDTNPPVTYYGGPVMPGTTNVYVIFWFPGDKGEMDTYLTYIKQYYQDVGGNRLYNMLSEYAGDNGTPSSTTLKGFWKDTGNQYPPQIQQQDMINEVKRAIAANNWPNGGYTDYFPVYTLPGANVTGNQTGSHGSFGPQDNPTIWSFVTYCSSGMCDVPTHPNDPNNYATDGAISVSAHEQFEAATDAGVDMGLGWRGTGEIGDLCTGNFGPTPYPYDQGQANQDWDNSLGTPDPYIIQTIMSDTPLGCILGTS